MDNLHNSKERAMLMKQDFKRRKKLHDNIFKFKNQVKVNKERSDYETEISALEKFEERFNNHTSSVSKNHELIKKMREKENEYLEKLKQTLERQKAFDAIIT